MSAGTARPPAEDVVRRLCWIMHNAWVDARNCAGNQALVFDLADAMHFVSLLLRNYCEPWIGISRQLLADYPAKHPGSFDYLHVLDHGVPDDSDWLWLSANEQTTP